MTVSDLTESFTQAPARATVTDRVSALIPGLAVAAAITVIATVIAGQTGAAGPLAWALLIGLAVGPWVRRGLPSVPAGTTFASRTLLRVGVALLGLGVSVGQAIALGPSGLTIAIAAIGITLSAAVWIGVRLRIDRDLSLLIGVGTAVCGASAIAATTAATDMRRSQVGYAVATVTMFGTIAMLGLPPLGRLLGLDETGTGIWIGASIQEVAQVTAAGAAVSGVALKAATLVKLIRVALLAAVLVAIRLLRSRETVSDDPNAATDAAGSATDSAGRPKAGLLLPPFILVFLALMLIRSAVPLPGTLLSIAATASALLQTAALAAIGLQVDLSELRAEGPRPVLLGLSAALLVSTVALTGVLALT